MKATKKILKWEAGVSMLESVERVLQDRGAAVRVAPGAYEILEGLTDRGADAEASMKGYGSAALQGMDFDNPEDAAKAIAIASVLDAKRANTGNATVTEHIYAAMTLLSERYQADW